jgi:EAL domain-containing protein (putative c-di-GMP-specific phosphodiesterase class I)
LIVSVNRSLARNGGIEPQCMVPEITEAAAVSDVARVPENLARLRVNGFTLSIDDYGTRYPGMQQLSRVAFSELKIDRSFVNEFASGRDLIMAGYGVMHLYHIQKQWEM